MQSYAPQLYHLVVSRTLQLIERLTRNTVPPTVTDGAPYKGQGKVGISQHDLNSRGISRFDLRYYLQRFRYPYYFSIA